MKRFLSILLAAVLVISMLPTVALATTGGVNVYTYTTSVSAMTEEALTAATEAGNYTTSLTANGIKTITYDSVNGSKWAYNNHAAKGVNMTGDAVVETTGVVTSSGRLMVNVEVRNIASAFLALKLDVEEEGIYDLEIGAIGHPYSCVADVYLFPAGEITKVTVNDLAGKTPVNEVNSYSESTSSKVANNKPLPMGSVHLESAGEYYIVFKFKENTNGQSSDTYPRQYFYLREIKLTETPPKALTVSPESVSVTVDETATITSRVTDSADAEMSVAKVTYESENPAIATVDATTGKVTGVGDGTTNIIAKVAGYDLTAKVAVTVKDYNHEYVFKANVFTDEAIEQLETAGADLTQRDDGTYLLRGFSKIVDKFEYINEEESDLWAASDLGIISGNLDKSYFNIAAYLTKIGSDSADSRFVVKLKVRYPGIYDLGIETYGYSTDPLSADIYMLNAAGVTELNNSVIRAQKKIGTIDGAVANKAENPVGVVELLTAGDYYLIFDLWSKAANTDGKQNIYPIKATLTPHNGEIVEEDTSIALGSKKLSFALGSTANAEIKVNKDVHSGNEVYKFDRSEEITVEAGEAPEGMRFKAWVQGTADNGTWKSDDAKYTFNIMTHTYLTAVYEAVPAENAYVVEYYNENGKYITTKEANGTTPDLPEAPKLTGYSFNMWTLDGKTKFDENVTLTEKLTRVVAKYNANPITENHQVKCKGEKKTGNFGTGISVSDENATHWLRDGRVVGYGNSYTHYIWDGTSIYCSYADIEENPRVVIEDTLIDGAVMIEYDAGNKQIIETGILFGEATVEIGSCEFKATSQWNKSHGQFTALPSSNENYARGYLIYNDGGVYKVIYTDAVSVQ